MTNLNNVNSLVVDQEVEGVEAFTGPEQANAYVLRNRSGEKLFEAREEQEGAGGFIKRNFLESARPFTIKVVNRDQQCVLEVDRPFTFFLDRMEVKDRDGTKIGTVEQHFSVFKKKFSVNDRQGRRKFMLMGPLFSPWTINVKRENEKAGMITKEWSGAGKELFTDEDQFAVKFQEDMDASEKKLLIGALFLIDFKYFERSE
jgi:uncharacterized protein YxjI